VGRIIGIDLGLKRTGLAVTDPDQMIATPLEAIETVHLLEYLKKYCSNEEVDGFALGDPLKPDGSPTHTTEAVKQMAVKLKEFFPGKEIFLVDERYTSSLAMDAMLKGGTSRKYRRNKGNIDKISATIILQSYLERKSNR
jgi:putative Holliday junction resolvase